MGKCSLPTVASAGTWARASFGGVVSRRCQHQRKSWEGLGRGHDKRQAG